MIEMSKIQNAIAYRFSNHKYKLYNSYVFNWESDFFSTTNDNRYIYEVEVKISRSDFFADFKKGDKHTHLYSAMKQKTYGGIGVNYHKETPNRFYYCCPDGMITPEELPEYAGLIYFIERGEETSYNVREIKKAPFIHKNNNVDKYLRSLIDKFYFQFQNMRSEYSIAKSRLKNHEKVIKENARLLSMVDLAKDDGYMKEVERLKKELEKKKDENSN